VSGDAEQKKDPTGRSIRLRQRRSDLLPHCVLLEAIADRRKRVDVKLIRFPRHPDGTGL